MGTDPFCTVTAFPGPPTAGGQTSGGRTMSFANITDPSSPAEPRLPVLITAGIHAREWAPPDAVISFMEKLLVAAGAGGPAVYHRLVQRTWPGAPAAPPPLPVVYPGWTVPADAVRSIINNLDLYLIPLMNPDGREFSQLPTSPNDQWRKNRGATTAAGPCLDATMLDQSIGTDVNRNFPMAWRFEDYYAGGELPGVSTASDPCVNPDKGELYRGDAASSEPETQNHIWLLDDKDIRYLIDVHSYGRHILHPWATSKLVAGDTENFQNNGLDHTRTKSSGEYMPQLLLRRHQLLGGYIEASIAQVRTLDVRGTPGSRFGSDYKTTPSLTLYPHTGVSTDFQVSRQFGAPTGAAMHANPVPPERYAFTIECGHITEHEFWPDHDTEYPKIEREVHAALWGLLSCLASPLHSPDSAWPILPGP